MSRLQNVVFDTSTLVGAALRVGSIPHQALLKALCFCDVCASSESLAEIEEVINRSKFDRYLNRDERLEFIANLRRRARLFVVQNADTMAKPVEKGLSNRRSRRSTRSQGQPIPGVGAGCRGRSSGQQR